MRIWAKLMLDGKVAKDTVYSASGHLNEDNFQQWLYAICDKLEIPSPVLLPQHFLSFMRFHNCRFYEYDFVESFTYERLILEDCKD